MFTVIIIMKYSFIIPCYNSELYVEKCLVTIFEQTYNNIEIIVINDGSIDSTDKIVKKIIEKNKNNPINIIYKKIENHGVSYARNLGLKYCSGDWIIFLDSDDYIDRKYVETLNSIIIKNDNIDLIVTPLIYVNSNQTYKQSINNKMVCTDFDKEKLISCLLSFDYGRKKYDVDYGDCRCIGGKCYKSSLIKNNNLFFDTNLKTFEDGVFNIRCYHLARNILFLNNNLYYYNRNENSATNKYNKNYLNDMNDILSKLKENIAFFESKTISESYNYCLWDLLTGYFSQLIMNNKYHIYKKEIKKIYSNTSYKEIIDKLSIKYMNTRNKVIYFIYEFKNPLILYISFKIRNIKKRKNTSKR